MIWILTVAATLLFAEALREIIANRRKHRFESALDRALGWDEK